MGQLKFGMENRFIILLKYNQNCPQQQSPSALLLLLQTKVPEDYAVEAPTKQMLTPR